MILLAPFAWIQRYTNSPGTLSLFFLIVTFKFGNYYKNRDVSDQPINIFSNPNYFVCEYGSCLQRNYNWGQNSYCDTMGMWTCYSNHCSNNGYYCLFITYWWRVYLP